MKRGILKMNKKQKLLGVIVLLSLFLCCTITEASIIQDSHKKSMVKVLGENHPPSTPVVVSSHFCNVNIEYTFSLVSYDSDNDYLNYNIEARGDGTGGLCSFRFPQGEVGFVNHTYTSCGVMKIICYAEDTSHLKSEYISFNVIVLPGKVKVNKNVYEKTKILFCTNIYWSNNIINLLNRLF